MANVKVLFKFCCLLCPFESETLILAQSEVQCVCRALFFCDQDTPSLRFTDILGEYSPAHF